MQETLEPKPQLTDSPVGTDVVLNCQNVHKKFCRSLRRSLWYGVRDIVDELNPLTHWIEPHERDLRQDEFWAVNDVSFQLRRGECVGLIGHNGAGKTTLLKLLCGLIKPDRGQIEVRGRLGALIALGAGFNPILTGRENVGVNASILGLTDDEIDQRMDEIIDFAGVGKFIDMPVQSYSSGMKVRLGFAIAACIQPDILLLDEVLAVGDMAFQAKCFNTLARFRQSGTAFILVSHNMHQVGRHASEVLHLDRGMIFNSGDPATVIQGFLRQSRDASRETHGTGPEIINHSIEIDSVMFCSVTGEPVTKIGSGEAVCVEIQFSSRQVHSAVLVDFTIRDEDGILFQTFDEPETRTFKNPPQDGRIRIELPSIPVTDAELVFHFTILHAETKEYLAWIRGCRLRVFAAAPTLGRVSLQPSISMQAMQ